MSIDKCNAEGYYDPTACEALSLIEKEEHALRAFRPIVYICSPYAGDIDENIKAARSYSRFAVGKGYIPIAPHLLFPQFLNDVDKEQRELGLCFALILLGKCDELWVFGDRVSDGMAREIANAQKHGIPVRYFNNNCKEVDTI